MLSFPLTLVPPALIVERLLYQTVKALRCQHAAHPYRSIPDSSSIELHGHALIVVGDGEGSADDQLRSTVGDEVPFPLVLCNRVFLVLCTTYVAMKLPCFSMVNNY